MRSAAIYFNPYFRFYVILFITSHGLVWPRYSLCIMALRPELRIYTLHLAWWLQHYCTVSRVLRSFVKQSRYILSILSQPRSSRASRSRYVQGHGVTMLSDARHSVKRRNSIFFAASFDYSLPHENMPFAALPFSAERSWPLRAG